MQQTDASKIIAFEENLMEFYGEKPESIPKNLPGIDKNNLSRSLHGFQPDSAIISQNESLVNHSSNSLLTNGNFDRLSETRKPESRNSGSIDKSLDSGVSRLNGLTYKPILSDLPNLYKHNGVQVENSRFIKFIPGSSSDWLQENYPNAFLLLCLIAKRARRFNGHIDGLAIGMAQIGDYKKAGIDSEKKYRKAKQVLIERGIIEIVETRRSLGGRPKSDEKSKNDKKGATRRATNGTLITLLKSDIWDINPETEGDQNGDQRATKGRPKGDEQEREEDKKIEETIDGGIDSSLSDFDGKEKENPSTALSPEKQKEFEVIWKYIQENKASDSLVKNGIKQKDVSDWLIKYEYKSIVDSLKLTMKARPNKTWPGYVTKLLKEGIAKKEDASIEGREHVATIVNKNKMIHIEMLQDYFRDTINNDEMYYHMNKDTLTKFLEMSWHRAKNNPSRKAREEEYN